MAIGTTTAKANDRGGAQVLREVMQNYVAGKALVKEPEHKE